MERIFPEVLRLSMLAGAMVPAVLLIRLLLGKAPKSLRCVLWMLVGIRLMVPFSIKSAFGLFPERGSLADGMTGGQSEQADAFLQGAGVDPAASAGAGAKEAPAPPEKSGDTGNGAATAQAGDLRMALRIGSAIWFFGTLFMAGYFFHSWFKIRACVRMASMEEYLLEDRAVRIYRCGEIETPFLFGVMHPRICVPSSMDRKELPYIVRHEMAHRRRGDHLVKPLSFFLLSVHWFNPLIWVAFKMLCRDMELACDEMVIRDMKGKDRKAYARALLNSSVWKEKAATCPVAFGELSVKERVRNILNYRKPTVWTVCLGAALCAVLLLCFMTQKKPRGQRILLTNEPEQTQSVGEAEGEEAAEQGVEAADTETQEDFTALGSRAFVESWAEAFCSRDGRALAALCARKLSEIFREGETVITLEGDGPGFGWSSPWPWDGEADYRIMSLTDTDARILYYAWTSDPHVTVWEEKLTFHSRDGRFLMDSSELDILDNICTGEEFYRAYPGGVINGTRMDYLTNEAGEALNDNAMENRDFYEPLFAPDTAARFLLNMLNNEGKVEISVEKGEGGQDAGEVRVSVSFILDHEEASVTMVRPYGEDGIWIPQTTLR